MCNKKYNNKKMKLRCLYMKCGLIIHDQLIDASYNTEILLQLPDHDVKEIVIFLCIVDHNTTRFVCYGTTETLKYTKLHKYKKTKDKLRFYIRQEEYPIIYLKKETLSLKRV
jgi:hypothetical protein